MASYARCWFCGVRMHAGRMVAVPVEKIEGWEEGARGAELFEGMNAIRRYRNRIPEIAAVFACRSARACERRRRAAARR